MNTEIESPPDQSDIPTDFGALEKSAPTTPIDDTVATLIGQLQHEIDQRKEERFLWIFAAVGLVDFHYFGSMSFGAIVAMALFQLAFLIAAARWLGVDHVVLVLNAMLDYFLRKKNGDES